jgi:hypothetical protein
MVTSLSSVRTIDRRTKSLLIASSEAAEAFSDVAGKIAAACADGELTEKERHMIAVELLVLRSKPVDLDWVLG